MDGSLCDHPVRKLLELCERHRLTGTLDVTSWGRSGRVEMRAGQVTAVAFGTLQGHAAMAELHALRDGLFELHPALPRVDAGQRGERLPLSAVIEQCRTRALSCRVEVVSRKRRAVITYRAGELEDLEVDGGPLPEGLQAAEVLAPFEQGQVRVEVLPLSLHEPAVVEAAAVQATHAPGAAGAPGSGAHQVSRPAGREDSRPARVAPAARDASGPNRVHAARDASGPNRVPPAREGSRPNRVHAAPPPLPPARREGSGPNRVHAAREGSGPNRAPGGVVARPKPRHKSAPVANPTLRPMPLDPSSNTAPIPVALGRAQADGPGPASGVGPWFDNANPSGTIASPRNALASRRDLAVPAILTVIVLSLLLIIGFVALQP
jgi:hypothetical protein